MNGDTANCSSNKHQITPLKMKAKVSKSEYDEDVHNLCSSPVTPPRTKLSKSQSNSPCPSSIAHAYYLDLCSQDLPEVIWDYSPKHRKDRNNDEKLLVIDDLLQYMHKKPEVPAVDSQTVRNLQLLEKWMEVKNVSPISPRVGAKVIKKRISKKRTCRLLREIQAMLNNADSDECSSNATNSSNVCQKQQVEERIIENNPLNSDNDIWGSETDNDDYILVKATQEVESCLMNFKNDCNDKLVEDTCTFKTMLPESKQLICKEAKSVPSSSKICDSNFSSMKLPFNVINKAASTCTSTVTERNENGKYLCLDNTWDNEFDDVLEPETFSQIPDDILMGKINKSTSIITSSKCSDGNNIQSRSNLLCTTKTNYHEYDKMSISTSLEGNSDILVNNTELSEEGDSDDPFNDGLNEEDFLAWADQTESLFSIKCTPEEIKLKKEVAKKKLQQKKG